MDNNPYENLSRRLDSLPNGFPASADGIELQILAKLFTPEEANLAAQLRLTLETPTQLAARIGGSPAELRKELKSMARRGLIKAESTQDGLGFGLMPFVVGIYEMQVARLDVELASLFERYFLEVFGRALAIEPNVHRVIPINESIPLGLEIQPYENAAASIASVKAWGVSDCICRKQKQLIGQGCSHPLDVCLALSSTPGAFDHSPVVHALSQEEALSTLRRAAEAGLVHSVSNHQKGLWYICNCCTCSCGILRSMVDLGLANVIAKSAYILQIEADRCVLCGACIERCQFDALSMDSELRLDDQRCAGCGVCTISCPEDALHLALRAPSEIIPPPESETDWQADRAQARNLDLQEVL